MNLLTQIKQLLNQTNPFDKDIGEIQVAPREIRNFLINFPELSSVSEQEKSKIAELAVTAVSNLGKTVAESTDAFGVGEIRINRIALALLLAGLIGLATNILTPKDAGDLLRSVISTTNATACSMVACYWTLYRQHKKLSPEEQAIYTNIHVGIAHHGSLRHPASQEQDIYQRISGMCNDPKTMVDKLCKLGLIRNISDSDSQEIYVLWGRYWE